MPDSMELAPQPIRLADYRAPDFLIDTVDLAFDLGEAETLVKAHLALRRNPAAPERQAPLRLDGEELELVSLALDGAALVSDPHRLRPDGFLIVTDVPDALWLFI